MIVYFNLIIKTNLENVVQIATFRPLSSQLGIIVQFIQFFHYAVIDSVQLRLVVVNLG